MPIPASDPILCATIARACLIEPSDDSELAQAVRLADVAVQSRPDYPWCCVTEGIAQYRLGKYGPALVWLSRGLSPSDPDDRRDAMAELFIGMTFERLERSVAAHSAMRRGLQIMETTVQRPGIGDLGYRGTYYSNDFQDTVFAHVSQREAEAIFAQDVSGANSVASSERTLSRRAVAELRSTSPAQRKIEVLNEWLSIRPDDAPALSARGLAFAEEGNFPRAAADLAKAIHLNPQDSRSIRYGLPLFLICGDERRFSELRAQSVPRVSKNDAMIVAGSVLRPTSAGDLDAAVAIVDKLVAANRNDCWNCFAKGLAEYRRGHYSDAATWLTAADSDENVTDPYRVASSKFYLAIAHYREGNKEAAKVDLEVGRELLKRKMVKPQERNLNDSALLDWMICQIARSEAASQMP